MGATFNVPFKATSGRNGRVMLTGTILAMGKWQVDISATDISVRNFELQNPGFDYGVPGIIGSDQSFEGAFNILGNPHQNPPNANPGQILNSLLLYLNKNPQINLYYEFPEIRTLGGSTQCAMDQFVNYSVKSKSNGSWNFPGGIPATISDI